MTNNPLHILQWKCIPALHDTIDQTTHVMDAHNIHIAILQETICHDTVHSVSSFAPKGYAVFHNSRHNPNRKPCVGGGVAILVCEHFLAIPRSDVIPSALCESVFSEVKLGEITVTISPVYITLDAAGTRSMPDFVTLFPLVFADIVFTCGDFDSHIPVWDLSHDRR